jgi:branched-chain amino acid transport system substrate-binding protein
VRRSLWASAHAAAATRASRRARLQIYGAPGVQGVKNAANDINQAGGIEVGGKTYDLSVAVEDTRSDPSQVVSAARAVVDSGAIATLGPGVGEVPAYQVFKSNDIITFAPSFAVQLELMQHPADNPLLFTPIPFLAELYEANMKQFAAQLPELKRVAILAPNNEVGKASSQGYAAAAEKHGLTVVANEGFAANATDFTSVLTSMKQKQPDVLIALQSAEEAIAILQQAAQLDVAEYGLNDTMTPDQAQQAQALDKITVIIPNFSPTFSPQVTIPDYDPEVVFGDEKPAGTPGAAIVTYYATHILKQAIEDAGTVTDSAAIAQEIPGQSYDGPFGTCTMSERRELDCQTLLEIVEGERITVFVFPSPDSVKPSQVYTCAEGNCRPQ